MLVLSRRLGETIEARLPDGRMISVTVVEIRSGQVKLGFVAPMEVAIHRTEVWDSIRSEGNRTP